MSAPDQGLFFRRVQSTEEALMIHVSTLSVLFLKPIVRERKKGEIVSEAVQIDLGKCYLVFSL